MKIGNNTKSAREESINQKPIKSPVITTDQTKSNTLIPFCKVVIKMISEVGLISPYITQATPFGENDESKIEKLAP